MQEKIRGAGLPAAPLRYPALAGGFARLVSHLIRVHWCSFVVYNEHAGTSAESWMNCY